MKKILNLSICIYNEFIMNTYGQVKEFFSMFYFEGLNMGPGMVAHSCTPSTQETAKPYLEKAGHSAPHLWAPAS
jgi:hypothetical protein